MRVLAVTATPASGAPGTPVELRLEAFDGLQHPLLRGAGDAGAESEVEPLQLAWLGGCHNPPGDAHFGCYPLLRRIAAELPSPLPPSGQEVPPEERPFWGAGSRFALQIPESILEGRALATDAPPFGVSFAFFAACRGRLQPAPEEENDVPLRCESASGERAGSEGFVRGFATVYTYAGSVNRAPVISAKLTDGAELPEPECQTDADCAELAGSPFGSACRSPLAARINGESSEAPLRCLPAVPRCAAADCPSYELWPSLAPGSVELDPSAAPPGSAAPTEILWVRYYALRGISEGQSLIQDRASGMSPSYSTRWRPPPRASDTPLPVWAVVQDNRGGVSVARWDFVVTE